MKDIKPITKPTGKYSVADRFQSLPAANDTMFAPCTIAAAKHTQHVNQEVFKKTAEEKWLLKQLKRAVGKPSFTMHVLTTF